MDTDARAFFIFATTAALIVPACGPVEEATETATPTAALLEEGEELSGGLTTVFDASPRAFMNPAANLASDRRLEFYPGNSFFSDSWVMAPSSTEGRDGLGPVFNARSCSSCHLRDGRGAPPREEGEAFQGLLLRLSIPGEDEHGGPRPDPVYGGQLQHLAIDGVPAEATTSVTYEAVAGAFDDGTPYELRRPVYTFSDPAFGPLPADLMVSPRVAPAMIGLGLLAAVDEATLTALADPDDADGDGISGRINQVWDVRQGALAVGRFGWKANQPTLEQQSAGAFLGDIGLTTSLFPDQNCPPAQEACRAAPTGGEPEVEDDQLEDVAYYSHLLAVPARRAWDDPTVLEGKALFRDAGCAGCHIPKMTTGALEDFPELSGQVIRPYTDLLLHDMGEGLSDGRPDFLATGSEWRTAPLWGAGLVEVVNEHTFFLHDGRARDLTEAILWHGGEAEDSQAAFRAMDAADREALLTFLESL